MTDPDCRFATPYCNYELRASGGLLKWKIVAANTTSPYASPIATRRKQRVDI